MKQVFITDTRTCVAAYTRFHLHSQTLSEPESLKKLVVSSWKDWSHCPGLIGSSWSERLGSLPVRASASEYNSWNWNLFVEFLEELDLEFVLEIPF